MPFRLLGFSMSQKEKKRKSQIGLGMQQSLQEDLDYIILSKKSLTFFYINASDKSITLKTALMTERQKQQSQSPQLLCVE